MTSPDSENNWEWVVTSNEGAVDYHGNDLSKAISIGNRISELRISAGLSAQDVEDYAGVRKSNLLALEAGLLELDAATADQLAMVLGVSAAELFT
ncbi:MAG: helix-turn-helix domain-containing protein [Granulosicoccus sp.]